MNASLMYEGRGRQGVRIESGAPFLGLGRGSGCSQMRNKSKFTSSQNIIKQSTSVWASSAALRFQISALLRVEAVCRCYLGVAGGVWGGRVALYFWRGVATGLRREAPAAWLCLYSSHKLPAKLPDKLGWLSESDWATQRERGWAREMGRKMISLHIIVEVGVCVREIADARLIRPPDRQSDRQTDRGARECEEYAKFMRLIKTSFT